MANLDNVTQYIAAGFARLDFHRLDSNGLPAGITGTVTAGATGSAAGRILAVVTANINIPAPTPVPVPGDNVLQGTFQFPSDQARSFEVQFSAENFPNRQAFQNILPVSVGNHSFAGRDVNPFSLNNLLLLGLSNASSKMSNAGRGLGMYSGVFATRAQLSVQGRQTFANRSAALYQGFVTLNAMNAYPWGQTFQSASEGYTESFIEDWTSQFPVTVHRWQQTSGLTVFNLAEVPASTSLNDVLVYVIDAAGNAIRQTSGVTISIANKTLTFSSAPADGRDIVAYYSYTPS